VVQDASLGPAAKLAYLWLWQQLGGAPGKISLTYGELGAALGKSPRAAQKWLDALRERGLVEVIDHDDRRGVLHLYVEAPDDLARPRTLRPDPQATLFDEPEEPMPESPDTVSIGADVCVHKRPRHGRLRAETSAPPGDTTPRARSIRFVTKKKFQKKESGPSGPS
jgi:DNA-binding transcriptional ArsR family regulator